MLTPKIISLRIVSKDPNWSLSWAVKIDPRLPLLVSSCSVCYSYKLKSGKSNNTCWLGASFLLLFMVNHINLTIDVWPYVFNVNSFIYCVDNTYGCWLCKNYNNNNDCSLELNYIELVRFGSSEPRSESEIKREPIFAQILAGNELVNRTGYIKTYCSDKWQMIPVNFFLYLNLVLQLTQGVSIAYYYYYYYLQFFYCNSDNWSNNLWLQWWWTHWIISSW